MQAKVYRGEKAHDTHLSMSSSSDALAAIRNPRDLTVLCRRLLLDARGAARSLDAWERRQPFADWRLLLAAVAQGTLMRLAVILWCVVWGWVRMCTEREEPTQCARACA